MNNKSALALLTPLLILANPVSSMADDKAISLDISGHMKMYMNYARQDGDARAVDILRDVDLTMSGETVLSNGLTVGALINVDADGGDSFAVQDSFVYLSGNWGQLSMGMENSASFDLQVEAPSADQNVDGMQSFVNPVNYSAAGLSGTNFEQDVSVNGLDYDNDLTAGIDKITYLTPLFSGFQAGVSYTPDVANFSPASRSTAGNNTDNVLDEFGDAWELGARFENALSDKINYVAGAGYSAINVEQTNAASTADTFTEWNTALDVNIGDYGIGAVYTENNGGQITGNDSKTWVAGTDYTIDKITYGASYLHNTHQENTNGTIGANRLAVGAVYEYGPGLTFRGSVSRVNVNVPTAIGSDTDATAVTVGTQILF